MPGNDPSKPWKTLALADPAGEAVVAFGPNDPYWTKRIESVRAGINDPEIMYVMRHFLDPNTIFVDGGANIGVWSGFAGGVIKKPKQVIAVEASDTTLAQLRQNQTLNHNSFTIVNRALYSKTGDRVTFNEMDNGVLSTLHPRSGQTPIAQKSVETITIDDIVENAFKASPKANKVVVKLDVQDAEREALAGAVKTLAERDALIIYEDARSSPNSETTDSLLKQGLHIYHIDANWDARAIHSVADLVPIKVPPRNGYNFLACKPGSTFDSSLRALCEQSTKLKAVLFDWDLTLADAENVNLAALNATFNAMAREGHKKLGEGNLNSAQMRQIFVGTVPSFFEGVYGEDDPEAVEKAIALFRKFRAERRSETKLLPGAKEILRFLQKKGIKVAIVSNKDTPELRALKDRLLPENEFSNIPVIGHETGIKAKPSPEPIHAALKALGLRPEQAASVLYVGDQMKSDVAAALAAGCQPCLIGEEDKESLFLNCPHRLQEGKNYAVMQNKTGHKILYAKDLRTLKSFLDTTLQKTTGWLSP